VGSQRAGSVGFPLLIPPDRAHWPRYITAQDVHLPMRSRFGAEVLAAFAYVLDKVSSVKDNLTYEPTILEKRSEKDSGSLG